MGNEYKRCFSRTGAPYMQSVTLVECDDVFEARRNVRTMKLNRGCENVDQITEYSALKRVHCELRKDWLKPISQLPNLEHIQFTLPRSDQIPSLKRLQGIRTLVLMCNRRQSNLNFIRGLTSLRSLCVSEANNVTSLSPISSITNLQELYYDGTVGGTGKVRSFAPISKLRDLRFAVLLVRSLEKKAPLRHLHQLKKLEYLFLGYSFAKDKEQLDALLEALPLVKKIKFNGGLTWPVTKR